MANVSLSNFSPQRTLDEPTFRDVSLTVLDWSPDGGGTVMSMGFNPECSDQGVMIVLPVAETLWLISRLSEALEARLVDGEYEFNLDQRPPIRVEGSTRW